LQPNYALILFLIGSGCGINNSGSTILYILRTVFIVWSWLIFSSCLDAVLCESSLFPYVLYSVLYLYWFGLSLLLCNLHE
jgi:hypothetical protein